MKNTLQLITLYLLLALFTVSCSEDEPAPVCLKAEVIGEDCQTGWYILKIENDGANGVQGNRYLGQLESGFVTTDNLPAAYRQPGLQLEVTVALNGEYGPRCVAVTVMYPAVKVTRVCSQAPISNRV